MSGQEILVCGFEWWWVVPIVMIILCVFAMRGRKGFMMCCPPSRSTTDNRPIELSDSAKDILDKRYALGEISKEEYEEKRKDIAQNN